MVGRRARQTDDRSPGQLRAARRFILVVFSLRFAGLLGRLCVHAGRCRDAMHHRKRQLFVCCTSNTLSSERGDSDNDCTRMNKTEINISTGYTLGRTKTLRKYRLRNTRISLGTAVWHSATKAGIQTLPRPKRIPPITIPALNFVFLSDLLRNSRSVQSLARDQRAY